MPIPFLAILTGAGKIAKISIKAGTALFRLVRANPRLTVGTVGIGALTHTITTHARTEQEKIQLIKEISEQNPSLGRELAQNLFPRPQFPQFPFDINILLIIIVIIFVMKILKD